MRTEYEPSIRNGKPSARTVIVQIKKSASSGALVPHPAKAAEDSDIQACDILISVKRGMLQYRDISHFDRVPREMVLVNPV